MTGVPTNLPFPFLSGSVDLILTSKLISNLISYIPENLLIVLYAHPHTRNH